MHRFFLALILVLGLTSNSAALAENNSALADSCSADSGTPHAAKKDALNAAPGCCAPVVLDPNADPLPSWNSGKSKNAILDFVKAVTDEKSADYVSPNDRIAVFDNDGTLLCEKPIYSQLTFALDRAKALVKDHPELAEQEPYKAALTNDIDYLAGAGANGTMQLMFAAHGGMTVEQFRSTVNNWLETEKHPRFHHKYDELIYQPMLELLSYLRANQFKTYIVSGGGVDFMRPYTEKVYGIPPEQVIGTTAKLAFSIEDGKPVLKKVPEIQFNDDKDGKPVSIHNVIGKRPIAAFGNSDGDLAMLQYTGLGDKGKRLCLFVHHTDDVREYAYDRESKVGHLEKGLDAAAQHNWVVVDMKNEWNKIFPFDKAEKSAKVD